MSWAGAFEPPAGRYFLSHSIGLAPIAARGALEAAFLSPWRRGDGEAWATWLAAIECFRTALAPIIGAEPDDICPQTNVSGALSKILFSLPDRARRKKIILTEDDFPTAGFALAQAERLGYELVFLPGGPRLADIDAWAPAFSDEAQLVFVTHVFSNSAVMAPVREIAARARERGVFSIVDIAQSAGAVPVALGDWDADFAVGSSVKFLCGGPGAGFLWTRPETAARCAPLDVGWFSHEDPFAFDIRDFRYAQGAARFWGGTPSVAPYALAAAGAETLAAAGLDAVYAHNQALLSRLVDALPLHAVLSHVVRGERGATALVRPREEEAATAALAAGGFIHDRRAGGIRLSVHLYNTEADVDALAGALAPLV